MSTQYKKRERVRHPGRDGWGLGEVLEDSRDDKVRVFFVGAGEKTLSLQHVDLAGVCGEDGRHPLLDHLKSSVESTVEYRSMAAWIELFLTEYPGGFYGEKYLRGEDNERDYKVKTHHLARELLDEKTLFALNEKHEYKEIERRALKVANDTNLIFPNEKMSLKDGLADEQSRKEFARQIYHLLHGSAEFEERFASICHFLDDIGAGKWTTATYFPFIMYPADYLFVKPRVTQQAADASRFEISYSPQINWGTYRSILKFADYLKDELAELKPRDMIDVQSFIWCAAPK